MGHKNADRSFNDPSAEDPQTGQPLHPPQTPPPNPEMVRAQGQVQVETIKAQTSAKQAEFDAQKNAEQAQLDAYHQRLKFESDAQLAAEKHAMDKEMALLKAALKERVETRDHELHQQNHAQQLHEHTITQTSQAHESKMQQAKAGKGAKASIEVKHGANELTGPIGEDVTKSQESHSKALMAAQEMSQPKQIVRDKTGKVMGVESA